MNETRGLVLRTIFVAGCFLLLLCWTAFVREFNWRAGFDAGCDAGRHALEDGNAK